MTEAELWKRLKSAMGLKWAADRIESKAGTGVPDVSYSVVGHHGWIELKTVKLKSFVEESRLNHPLTDRQIYWLQSRGEFAESAWVLIGADFFGVSMYFLVPWHKVDKKLNRVRYQRLREISTRYWIGKIDGGDMLHTLAYRSSGD